MRSRRVPSELVLAVVVAVIGVMDAAIGANPDLVVLFAALVVLSLIAIVRTRSDRNRVSVRSDVAAWLAATATAEGETVADLADRALSAYRAGLVHVAGASVHDHARGHPPVSERSVGKEPVGKELTP